MRKNIFLSLFIIVISSFCKAQDVDYAKKIIDSLCSEEMYGRGYVNDGDIKAANFIQTEFEKIGLKPLGESYQQKFNFNINTFEGKQFAKIGKEELKLGIDYIVSPNSGSGKGKVKLMSYKKFKSGKGTIKKGIVVNYKEYHELVSNELMHDALYDKIIVRKNEKKLTASLAHYQLTIPVIEVLTSENQKIKKIEFEINAKVKENYESQNVIGLIEGSIKPDSFLVFCAHYDHLGGMGDIYFPGANDNAAGIAMLMEMAKYYKENPPKYSVIFIAFGGEEVGLVGSKFFVENSPIDLGKIKFLVNMDLVGTGEKGITVVNGKVFKKDFERLTSINEELKLLSTIKSRGKAANSDHYYFSEKGVPSFFIYAMGEPSHYHNINDNGSDLKLEEFDDIMKLIIELMAY